MGKLVKVVEKKKTRAEKEDKNKSKKEEKHCQRHNGPRVLTL